MAQTSRSGKEAEPAVMEPSQAAVTQKTSRAGRKARAFDYGELRLLLLAMIAKQPSHGYELIHEIKERLGGTYKPSPGVIYPALTWLYDRGYSEINLEKGGRKRYVITEEGMAFLSANKTVTDRLMARVVPRGQGNSPPAIVEAMDQLKRALSLRVKLNITDESVLERVGEAIRRAAEQVETLLASPALPEATLRAVADIVTPNAQRYLRRLCSHFHHRTPVTTGEGWGQFQMSIGEVRMEESDGVFRITVSAVNAEKLHELQQVLVRHLEETAVRETLEVNWRTA